jgi:membrane protein implicated in regulation of membrane protease activity
MTWAEFYLICFFIGFVMCVLSVVIGALDLHVPGFEHGHFHFGDGGDLHVHADMGHGGLGHGDAPGVSPFNFATLMAFLAWFGGAGYLLTSVWKVFALLALAGAVVAGLAGGSLVFMFLAKVLMRNDATMHESDYELAGTLAKVSMPIREQGIGEIVFSLQGTRQTCGARSADGTAIAKGTEVVITGYEHGIAEVRPWTELAEGPDSLEGRLAALDGKQEKETN